MNIPSVTSIDRSEWLKLLHVAGTPDARLLSQMAAAQVQLLLEATPRGIYRVLDIQSLPLEGTSIRKHLEGCSQAAVLAVTAGSGVDALLRRTQVSSMSMAVIMDAGASVLAEQIADAAEEVMKKELKGWASLFTTPRFSPGYGDYPLHCQEQLLSLVDASRKAGISLSSGHMMTPGKSISAVIGLSDHPVQGRLAPCSECLLREKCHFLKNGLHC